MGTLTYTTDKTAGQILTDELCGPGVRIRMFTTDKEAACVALSVDLAAVPADYVEHLRRVYDLAPDATHAFPAVIVKGSGFNGRGARPVDVKIMDECGGPYFTGGANRQLLGLLSPIKDCAWAQEWRARAAGGAS
tara:strand:- start:491 stop:895 length:405 start_codon:yes stop_codon:yes gene_type:complete